MKPFRKKYFNNTVILSIQVCVNLCVFACVLCFRVLPERYSEWSSRRLCLSAAGSSSKSGVKLAVGHTRGYQQVYDLFLFNDELDMLEIRINELKDAVDYFVVVEARVSFTNMPKPLHFSENKDRFNAVSSKIVHIILDVLSGNSTWEREASHRNALLDLGLHQPGKEARRGDIVIMSDVDEIPRSAVVVAMKKCPEIRGRVVVLELGFFYYSYLNRAREPWSVPMALQYPGPDVSLNSTLLRKTNTSTTEVVRFRNAGWHCSYCFSTLAAFRNKVQSFSHEEYNLPEYFEKDHVVRSVQAGVSLFDHLEPDFFSRLRRPDAPRFVLEHARRFQYLLNRRSKNAGLSDIPTVK